MQEIESIYHDMSDEKAAKNLSEEIENYIKEEAKSVEQLAETHFSSFIDRVNAATTHLDLTLTEIHPTALVSDPEKFDKLKKQRDHDYDGPDSIAESQEWAKIADKVKETVRLSEYTQTEDGQILLIKRIRGEDYKNVYLKHDLRLLALYPPSKVNEADDLPNHIDLITEKAKNHVIQAKKTTEEAKKQIREKIESSYKSFQDRLKKNHESILTARMNQKTKILSELESGVVSQDTIKQLGPEFEKFARSSHVIYSLNLKNYTLTVAEPTKFETASLDDYKEAECHSKIGNLPHCELPIDLKDQANKHTQIPVLKYDFNSLKTAIKANLDSFMAAQKNEVIDFHFSKKFGGVTITHHTTSTIEEALRYLEEHRVGNDEFYPWIKEEMMKRISAKQIELCDRFKSYRMIKVI